MMINPADLPVEKPRDMPYLLWMGECVNDHRIDSMDDLRKVADRYACKACWKYRYESTRPKGSSDKPKRRNFATLKKDPNFWAGGF